MKKYEFGSFAGISDLQIRLDELIVILDDITRRHIDTGIQIPNVILIYSLKKDLEACIALSHTLLANQILLLNRVIVQRTVLFSYLLWNEEQNNEPDAVAKSKRVQEDKSQQADPVTNC